MDKYSALCLSVFLTCIFGSLAVESYGKAEAEKEASSALKECYKAAQVNPQLKCQ